MVPRNPEQHGAAAGATTGVLLAVHGPIGLSLVATKIALPPRVLFDTA
jgi:hypothetical protein